MQTQSWSICSGQQNIKGKHLILLESIFILNISSHVLLQVGKGYRDVVKPASRSNVVNHGKVNTKHVTSRLNDKLNLIEEKAEIRVGDKVEVKHPAETVVHKGTVRFIGKVDFTEGDGR